MYFLSTMPGVLGIVFCDDEYWFKECSKFNLQCISEFPSMYFSSLILVALPSECRFSSA